MVKKFKVGRGGKIKMNKCGHKYEEGENEQCL
jgi:hypothetical protein